MSLSFKVGVLIMFGYSVWTREEDYEPFMYVQCVNCIALYPGSLDPPTSIIELFDSFDTTL